MPDSGFHEYVVGDVLAGIDGISSRAMFGGWGIYRHGKIFAIIADGKLYFKVGDNNRFDYENLRSKPFMYEGKDGKPYMMSYWELPEDVMENKVEILEWIEKSVNVNKKGKTMPT